MLKGTKMHFRAGGERKDNRPAVSVRPIQAALILCLWVSRRLIPVWHKKPGLRCVTILCLDSVPRPRARIPHRSTSTNGLFDRWRRRRSCSRARSSVKIIAQDGSFLVLVAGPGKVSWPRLRRHLGVSRLTTAMPEEVRRVTGYEPGAVSPIGLASPLRILADRGLVAHDVVSIGAGIRNAGVILGREDLMRVLQAEIGFLIRPEAGASRLRLSGNIHRVNNQRDGAPPGDSGCGRRSRSR
jgi:prolyl-tRNA editing enzyme YbaK/EbsC (Cys-tRNA(Pro) deacylase)